MSSAPTAFQSALAPPPPLEHPAALVDFWPLDPQYAFLNHGSFGSVPFVIRDEQRREAEAVERHPIEVLGRQCRARLTAVREIVGRSLGADPQGLGLVTNATEGINAVLRSIDLRPGDVLLTTNHVYYAVQQTMRFVARRAGAEVRIVNVPTPIRSLNEIADRIEAACDSRTRLVIADHVTSPTAVIFPVKEIATRCARRGIEFLCDGAHAPGMLELDIRSIGATYYAGNLHKWTCAPKGCGFVWVDESRRRDVHPTIASHFLDQGFDAEFDWQGTRDISAWLAIPAALRLWESPSLQRMRDHNRALARWTGAMLAARWQTKPLVDLASRDADALLGSMVAVTLPTNVRERWDTPESLQHELYTKHRIEIPVIAWAGQWHCRASCQIYNRPAHYERLADAVLTLG